MTAFDTPRCTAQFPYDPGRSSLMLRCSNVAVDDSDVCAEHAPCEHEFTVTETDNAGNEYTVCEDCEIEVEPEDTRSFYRDEETGRITW